jgi:small subunit ribosomal protein S20
MPIIKSAIKRMRQTTKRKMRNQQTKRSFRGEIKVLNAHIQAKDTKKASESLKKVQAELDKAVKKNVLKKNTAARKMSQLTAQVKAIGAKPAPSTKTKVTTPAKKTPAKAVAKKPTAKKPVAKKTPAKKPSSDK